MSNDLFNFGPNSIEDNPQCHLFTIPSDIFYFSDDGPFTLDLRELTHQGHLFIYLDGG